MQAQPHRPVHSLQVPRPYCSLISKTFHKKYLATHHSLVEHGFRSQRQPGSNQTPEEGVCRHSRRSIQLIRINKKIDALLENDIEACSDECGCDDWR